MAADNTSLWRASADADKRVLRRSFGVLSVLAIAAVTLPLAITVAVPEEPTPGLPAACVPTVSFEGDIAGPDPTVCPEGVTNVVVVPGNNEVSLSWGAPVNAEVAGVVEYVVDVRTDRRVVSVPATQTSVVVSGLTNGVEARFAVHAVGTNGASDASDEVITVPTTGVEGEVAGLIVKFEESAPTGDVVTFDGPLDSTINLQVVDEVANDTVLVELPESVTVEDAEFIAEQIADDPGVAWVEPDRFLFIAESGDANAPNDTEWSSSQWNLWGEFGIGVADGPSKVGSSWSADGGAGSVVAVIDTGITQHPELENRLVDGYDFVSNPDELAAVRSEGEDPVAFDGDYVNTESFGNLGRDANPADPGDWRGVIPVRDSSWHGTAMAGIIAATPDNGEGISGIAPGARVQPIRALSWRGGLLSDIAASITWASGGAVDNVPANATPSNVINLSFAVEADCPIALQESINGAIERGAVVVAAAGNANADVARFAPGNCDGVVTVGATNRDGLRAPYSNWGEGIDVSAPGGSTKGGVLTTSNAGSRLPAASSLSNSEGTSVAAAHVAAAAAIIRALNPAMSHDDVVKRLIGRDHVKKFGGGSCDADPTRSCGAGILSLAQIAMVRQGNVDYAMTLNGTNQYATAPDSAIFDLSANFTIEAWLYPTAASGCFILKRQVYEMCLNTSGYWFGLDDNVSGWNWYPNSGVTARLNSWQHFAFVKSGTSTTLYIDSESRWTANNAPSVLGNSTNSFAIGVQNESTGSGPFAGKIDEVRIYDDARTQAEIAADMHTYGPILTSGSATPNLVAYYDFNEGGGATILNRVSGAPSVTHLTTVGSPDWADVKTTATTGSDTVVTFPRSYLNAAGGWSVPDGVTAVRALLVGGGGGGGGDNGGGGGGGGVYDSSTASVSVAAGAQAITVGQGAAGVRYNTTDLYKYGSDTGQSTQAFGLTAGGGGRGGNAETGVGAGKAGANGTAGGSGGGGASESSTTFGIGGARGTGTVNGYAGGNGSSSDVGGAGGGGAGQAGSAATTSTTGRPGGSGLSSNITGSAILYGGGGGGGNKNNVTTRSTGGSGGGGRGASSTDGLGEHGTANLGGGGGGGTCCDTTKTTQIEGGSGGSGVVIVRYSTSSALCAPSRTTSGAKVFVAFKDVGTCRWSLPEGVSSVDYLVVAGGGGGGPDSGGGGGAGGVLSGTSVINGLSSVDVTVGAGGAGGTSTQNAAGQRGTNGGNSELVAATTITASGGGAGGAGGTLNTVWTGVNGGSGGGSAIANAASYGTGTSGQGSNGGLAIATCQAASQSFCGGGGGGAGGVGGDATTATTPDSGGAGGVGTTWNGLSDPAVARSLGIGEVSGSSVYFAGGGGGGAMAVAVGGAGGIGGGGAGDNSLGGGGSDAAAATGGGGGAGGRRTNSSTDVSSGGNGGSGVVVLSYTQPIVDYAVDLNGTGQYLRSSSSLTTLTQSITVEAWVRLESYGSVNRQVVFRGDAWGIVVTPGGLWQFQVGNYASNPGTFTFLNGPAVVVNEWTHIAMTRDSSTGAVVGYVNGVVAASATQNATLPVTYPIDVGSFNGAGLVDGRIDEVKVWNVARSAAEVLIDMHSYTPADSTGLVAYYDFNDGSGTTAYNRVSGAASSTNLTATGTPTYVDVKTVDATSVAGRAVLTFPRSYITAAGGWTVPQGVTTAEVLVVGGGGGGGYDGGGGGGGGGVLHDSSFAVTPGVGVGVTVGVGGSGASREYLTTTPNPVTGTDGGSGGNTVLGSLTATGGGGGGGIGRVGVNSATGDGRGGGGGGGAYHSGSPDNFSGGAGCVGCAGGSSLLQRGGGGGSGTGSVGTNATGSANNLSGGNGGEGASYSAFNGTVYGSGGGGGDWTLSPTTTRGQGGTNAGDGGFGDNIQPTSGTANTGAGGGGGGRGGQRGADGGSGVVMVSYAVPTSTSTCTSPVTSQAADGSGDVVVKFVTVGTCTWSPPVGVSSAQYLIVGGGGGGGGHIAGGGGGGEVVSGTKTGLSSSVSYSITVGAGGTGGNRSWNNAVYNGTSGGESSAFGVSGVGALRAAGGGGGATLGGGSGQSGGSGGGGGGVSGAGGAVAKLGSGLGFAGGAGSAGGCSEPTGGGGGGAGSIGEAGNTDGTGHGGDGGVGTTSTITGASVLYAGGGGGGLNAGTGCVAAGLPGSGGSGGGGAGGPNVQTTTNSDTAGLDGVANTGGGGGGASGNGVSATSTRSGGNGGSGIVIVRYTPTNIVCSPLSYASGAYTVVEFQTVGTCAWTVPSGVSSVSVLAVGGGGGGGTWVGGGGGGGGVTETSNVSVTASARVDVTVGGGGTGASRDGNGALTLATAGDTSTFGSSTPVTAAGGGFGASYTTAGGGQDAGSGANGGGAGGGTAGTSTGGGYPGGTLTIPGATNYWNAAGGGGAGGAGESTTSTSKVSGSGGPGKASSLTGGVVYYGGGGGGGYHGDAVCTTVASTGGTPGVGGIGGGGRGSGYTSGISSGRNYGGDGVDGLGGGGGGSAFPSTANTACGSTGGDGGDGTVIVRYLTPGATATITYNDNVADETITVPSAQTDNFNATISLGAAPSRTGYTFASWNTASDGSGSSYAAGGSLTLVSNETMYAQWTANSYTVTYDDNDVANALTLPCASQTGSFGATLTLCDGPSRSGYTFSGWNTVSGGSGTAYSAGGSYLVTAANETLYAQWTANSYTVTYNANGGTGAPSSSTVQYAQTATVSASTPTRTGHTFSAWTTESDGTGSTYASSATFTMGAANVTLYAKWTVNNYTVTYNDNVVSETISVPSTQTAAFDGSVTVGSAPTRSGYSFAGWNTDTNGSGTAYAAGSSLTIPAANTTLYAQWTVNTYTVSYNLNGGVGTAPTSQTASFANSVTVAGTSSTRTGFTFAGWNTDAGGAGTAKAAGSSFTIPAANTTFYAQWTADQYTITFAANDDVSNVATGLPSSVTGRTYQESVTLPSTEPTRPSYVFNGWNTAANGSGTSYAVSGSLVMPASGLTLHAQWVPANFGVVYNANGGSGAPAATNNAFGSSVTISTTQPTRTGYTFRWWTTTANGTGTTYRNPATGTSVTSFSMPGSQVTLYAQWLVNSYTVIYNANLGSNAPASQNVDFDATATASSSAPTRAGYQFLGWNTAANGTGTAYAAGGTFQMPATNVTLFAQWQAITYTVTYNVNGGDSAAPTSQSGTTDSTVTVSSTIPTRTGYNFSGWNTLASGFGTPRTPGGTFTMPAAPVTLYAQWNPQTLSISYNGNGGTSVPGQQNGVVDSSVTISAGVPTRIGHSFIGWNTVANGSGTSLAAGATFVMPTAAVVLYAQWQAIPYTLSYEGNIGTGVPASSTQNYLDAVTLSSTVPTRSGYWFNGWNTEADGSGSAYTSSGALTMPAAHVTLHAQWVANLYRVVYSANGGLNAPVDQVLATDSTVYVSDAVPTREGYDFTHWTTTQNGSGSTYSNPASGAAVDNFTMPGSNTTLFAQWVVKTFAFAYDANGGTGEPSGATTAFGATVTVAATAPTRTGHTFVGWNTSSNGTGTSYVAGNTLSMPAGALTLHAQWVANTYSITYFANGGSTTPSAQSETYGTVASVSATPATRTGYTFDGWNTQADGLGTSRTSGSSFTMSDSDVDLYAQWTAQTFAVSFNANEGSGAPSSVTGASDSTVTLPATSPTRDGYDFLGWNTLQAGTGTGYQVSSTLVMPPNNLTLWAQWQPQRFEIAYDVNGGLTNPPVGAVATTDSSVQAAATTPARTGYQFAGWNTVVDGSGISASAGNTFNMPPSNITLFAQWLPLNFRVTYDANGGSDAPTAGSGATDSTFTVSSSTPKRTGYTFTGWNTRADGTGTAYAIASTFTMPPNDVALWAQWSAVTASTTTSTTTSTTAPTTTPPTTSTSTTTSTTIAESVVIQLAAPRVEYVVAGRSVKIEPLKQAPPPGDEWDQTSMGVYALGSTAAQSTGRVEVFAVKAATKLKTNAGTWTVDRSKGTVAFVAAAEFAGRERIGFVVTTKLGVEYRTTLTVKVRAALSDLPVAGNNAGEPVRWATLLLVVGLLLCGFGRGRIRR